MAEQRAGGELLWRRATADVLGGCAETADRSAADAVRVAGMIGPENARRAYRLG